jgi:hypothetical protein
MNSDDERNDRLLDEVIAQIESLPTEQQREFLKNCPLALVPFVLSRLSSESQIALISACLERIPPDARDELSQGTRQAAMTALGHLRTAGERGAGSSSSR